MTAPCPEEGRGRVPQVQILECEKCFRGATRYRVTVAFGSLHIAGISILQQGAEWWTALPTRPRLDSKGRAMMRQGGGYLTDPVIDIPDPERKRLFDAGVIAALRTYLSLEDYQMPDAPKIQIPKIEIHNWRELELHKEREYCAFDIEFPELGMRLNNITQWEGDGERFRFSDYRGYDSGRIREGSPFETALQDALVDYIKNWERY